MPPIERRKDRIRRERDELNLRPWQKSPSEVTDADPPIHPVGTLGYTAWLEAQAWRRTIRAKQPGYFDVEDADEYWIDDDQDHPQ